MKPVGVIRDEGCLAHRPDFGHPESHKRLEALYEMLDFDVMRELWTSLPLRKAAETEILMAHTPAYLDRIAKTAKREFTTLTPDTHACENSFDAALRAAGGAIAAVSAVVSGEVPSAFALIRPPGHHAEQSRAMGYCLFSNLAVAARYARASLGIRRILIVDWDVHHGNGTQHAFEDDPDTLFFSIHQHPHFPGSGLFTQAGRGKGEGATINLPIPKNYGDGEYAALFDALLKPVAREFAPELILVSAGFDTHRKDPMGGMKMTEEGFAALTRIVMELAEQCCGGRLVLCLEGGYHLKALTLSVMAVLKELAGVTVTPAGPLKERASEKKVRYALHRALHVHGHFWKSLNLKKP